MANMICVGGPEDGALRIGPNGEPVTLEFSGGEFTEERDGKVRKGHKMYRYLTSPQRGRMDYQGERVVWSDEYEEEVNT